MAGSASGDYAGGVVHPQASKARDVDQVIALVKQRLPQVQVQQLQVAPPADDNGLWFFTHPGAPLEIQIESSSGQCPFLIESDASSDRVKSDTVEDTARSIVCLLVP